MVNPHLIKEMSSILLDKSALRNRNSTHKDQKFLAPLIGIETGSARLGALTMSGKSLPFDIRDWQEIVVEGTNILNQNNWFPVYTFIIGLPNETEEDLKQTLDLLHRLKNNKAVRAVDLHAAGRHADEGRQAAQVRVTQLQWEFMMTAWKQSRDFGEMRDRSRAYFKIGTKLFYYLRGKHVHGQAFKWPAMRFAGVPEEKPSQHLYLNWDKEPTQESKPPRLIPKHRKQTLEELRQINDFQPFNVFGTSRDSKADEHGARNPFKILSSYGSNGSSNSNCGDAARPEKIAEPVAGD